MAETFYKALESTRKKKIRQGLKRQSCQDLWLFYMLFVVFLQYNAILAGACGCRLTLHEKNDIIRTEI